MEKNNNELIEKINYFDNAEIDDKYEDDETYSDEIFQWDAFNYSIKGSVSNTDIETIINSLADGSIIVPGFQRKFVWNQDQVASLAFSFVKGIPVPPVYVYFDSEDGVEYILDGQQRITALFLYFHGLYFQNEDCRKKIDFKDVSFKMKQKKDIEEKLKEKQIEENHKDLLFQKEKIEEELKKLYGLVEKEYFIKDYAGNNHDISFEHYQEKEKRFLKRKAVHYAVVECAVGDSPEKFYTMVFRMLNSQGKTIGPQEIRNGLYWKTTLYKGLFEINDDDSLSWRRIYGRRSLYSKDVEILLKMMALNYYTFFNDGKESGIIKIKYDGTFNWGNIMSSYSTELSKKSKVIVDSELRKIKSFLEMIVLDDLPKKCRKATLEAVFVCMNKLCLLDENQEECKYKIKMSWLVNLSDDEDIFGDGKVLSNKKSVEDRISKTLIKVKEKYGKH